MNYDNVCYHRPCLSKVLVRLDFLEFIENTILFESDIEKSVLNSFPKKGFKQLVKFQTLTIQIPQNSNPEQTSRDGIQQEFTDAQGNRFIISNQSILYEINNYTTYEDLLNIFTPILQTMLNSFSSPLTVMRTGIRYINLFNPESIKPQKVFFQSNIGELLEINKAGINLIRSIATKEYVFEDMRLNFRYGMYNPQYPSEIKYLNYVLDYDCFCDGAIVGIENILKHIQKGHDAIQELFEKSITEKLRNIMR